MTPLRSRTSGCWKSREPPNVAIPKPLIPASKEPPPVLPHSALGVRGAVDL
jgi:hypothetical protein